MCAGDHSLLAGAKSGRHRLLQADPDRKERADRKDQEDQYVCLALVTVHGKWLADDRSTLSCRRERDHYIVSNWIHCFHWLSFHGKDIKQVPFQPFQIT